MPPAPRCILTLVVAAGAQTIVRASSSRAMSSALLSTPEAQEANDSPAAWLNSDDDRDDGVRRQLRCEEGEKVGEGAEERAEREETVHVGMTRGEVGTVEVLLGEEEQSGQEELAILS